VDITIFTSVILPPRNGNFEPSQPLFTRQLTDGRLGGLIGKG